MEQRSPRPLSQSERKDLTDFAHQEIASLLSCATCGVLQRDESETPPIREYVDDDYDNSAMDRLLPRYVEAFRAKERPYRELLESGAEILEIGSHLGAFLQVAKEWGWRARGVDVGNDTVHYARSKGHTVQDTTVEKAGFENSRFDGVFVWNCFEQIPEPRPTLREIYRILKTGGVLIIRTPNALFYRLCARILAAGKTSNEDLVVRSLAYNNLLAFPYLYGYDSRNLDRLVEARGFTSAGRMNSELITVPFPDTSDWVREDEQVVSRKLVEISQKLAGKYPSILAGPWMELIYRRLGA